MILRGKERLVSLGYRKSSTGKFPHIIAVGAVDPEDEWVISWFDKSEEYKKQIKSWLHKNIGEGKKNWCNQWCSGSRTYNFYFLTKDDALLFKLTWG